MHRVRRNPEEERCNPDLPRRSPDGAWSDVTPRSAMSPFPYERHPRRRSAVTPIWCDVAQTARLDPDNTLSEPTAS